MPTVLFGTQKVLGKIDSKGRVAKSRNENFGFSDIPLLYMYRRQKLEIKICGCVHILHGPFHFVLGFLSQGTFMMRRAGAIFQILRCDLKLRTEQIRCGALDNVCGSHY